MNIDSELGSNEDIESFISKVMFFEEKGVNYYQKFDSRYLISYLDRPKLQSIQNQLNSTSTKLSLVDFVKFFLGIIPHDEVQTLYLSMALIDIFKEISLKRKDKQITFLDLTNHFCEIITQKDSYIKIPLKLFPVQKSQNPNLKQIRDIDKKAPIIHERVNITLPKINLDKIKTDKTSHPSGPVHQVIYAKQLNRILALDTLSPSLKLFDPNLNFKRQLTPQQLGKNIKDLAILSFAYSHKEKRIGCIIKDIGMSFWEASDNFSTQKKISKQRGQKIYYFQLFEEWVTTQRNYTQFWDIRQEKIKLSLEGVQGSTINSVCEIPLLRVVCVAYTGSQAQKQLVLYQNYRQITRMPLGHAGCHTIHYNKTTQTLLPIGYKISVPVYQIHPQYFDFTLLTELKGHTSLVTCISDVENSSLIVTGDDIGSIRVWDLRTFKCVQVVKVARWLSYLLYVHESRLIFTDSRLNLINFQKTKSNIIDNQPVYPISSIYLPSNNTILIATSKQMRMYSAQNGELIQIFQVAIEDEMTFFKMVNERTFIAGTEQGRIKMYNNNGETISDFQAHSNQISDIKIDKINKIFLSASWDSDVHIWKDKGKEKEKLQEDSQTHNIVRSLKNNHFGKEVSLLQLSLHLNIIATGSVDKNVYLWDFQYSKLTTQIKLPAEPTCISFVDLYSLLIIGCSDGMIYVFRICRRQMKVVVELIRYFLQSSDDNFELQIFSTEVPSPSSSQHELFKKMDTDQKESILIPTKLLIDMTKCGFNLYIAFSKGGLSQYCFSGAHIDLEQSFDQTKKNNYTPFRTTTEDFHIEHSKGQFTSLDVIQEIHKAKKIEIKPAWSTQIHKDSINCLSIMDILERYLLTSSSDGYFKVVLLASGEVISSMNINHALPMRWDLKSDCFGKAKQRILLALKTIQLIFKKHESQITTVETKNISLKKLMTKLTKTNCIKQTDEKKPKLFLDQYEPGDLNPSYPRVKHMATLKELQAYKRVYLNGSGLKRQNIEEKPKTFKISNYQKIEDRDQFQFLSPYYLPRLINKGADTSVPNSNLKSIMSIFDSNKPQDQSSCIMKKKNQSRMRKDFIEHAKTKQYLGQCSQNIDSCFSQLMSNLNMKKEFSKKNYNRKKQSNWSLPSVASSSSIFKS